MPRKAERSPDELRAHLLECAQQIVEQEGLSSLTARRIAQKAGCAPGMLYIAFASLDDLILHLNMGTLDHLYERMSSIGTLAVPPRFDARAAVCDAPSGLVVLKQIGQAYLRFATESTARWRLVFEHAQPDPQSLPSEFEHKVSRLFDLVEARLGEISPQASEQARRSAARGLWSGVHGICILFLTGKLSEQSAGPIPSLIDMMIENFVAGFAARGG